MKTKQLNELRAETKLKLLERVKSLKLELIKVSLPSLGSEARDIKKIRNIKSDIAQILTIAGEKKDNSTL